MTGIALLFLLVGVLFTVGLYLLIEGETSSPTVVDRSDAEQNAQQFGGLKGRDRSEPPSSDDEETDDHWGHSRLDDERE